MKKMMTAVALAAVAMMGAMQVANADALDDIKKSGKIRIAVDLGVPPYGMTDDKMQPTGFDIETAKLLAKDWGLEFEHVPTTGASRIPSLQTGKADLVISTLSITPERAKVIDFSLGYAVAAHRDRRAQERERRRAWPTSTARPSAPCAAPRTTRSSPRKAPRA